VRSDRDRDAEMDRLLRTGLPGEPPAPAGACPSADDLAAYAERSLLGRDREAMESHLAGCGSCQEALALLASMDEAEAPAPAEFPLQSWWRAGWKRWLVPLGAVAAGVLLYVAIQPDVGMKAPDAARDSVVASLPARQPATPEARVEERVAPPPAAQPPQPRLKDQDRLVAPVPRQERQDSPTPREKPGKAKPDAPLPLTVIPPADATIQAPAPVPTLVGAQAVAAPPPPPPPSTLAAARAEAAKHETREQAAQALPVVGRVAARDVARRQAVEAPAETKGLKTESVVVTGAAPVAESHLAGALPKLLTAKGNPDVRWRLEGGRIWQSADGGQSWRLQHSAQGELGTGAAPSSTTCWAVGRAGLVLLTTDGETWAVRPFPESVDLHAVTAADARKATVTTKDGRRFLTEDGGATWSVQR